MSGMKAFGFGLAATCLILCGINIYVGNIGWACLMAFCVGINLWTALRS